MVHAELAASLKRRCSQNDDELRSELRAEEGEEVVVAAQQDKAACSDGAEAALPSDLAGARGAAVGQGSAPGCALEAEIDGVVKQRQRLQAQMRQLVQLTQGTMQQHNMHLQALQLQVTQARMWGSLEMLEKTLKQQGKVLADQKRQEDQACSTMHMMRRREEELTQQAGLLNARLAAQRGQPPAACAIADASQQQLLLLPSGGPPRQQQQHLQPPQRGSKRDHDAKRIQFSPELLPQAGTNGGLGIGIANHARRRAAVVRWAQQRALAAAKSRGLLGPAEETARLTKVEAPLAAVGPGHPEAEAASASKVAAAADDDEDSFNEYSAASREERSTFYAAALEDGGPMDRALKAFGLASGQCAGRGQASTRTWEVPVVLAQKSQMPVARAGAAEPPPLPLPLPLLLPLPLQPASAELPLQLPLQPPPPPPPQRSAAELPLRLPPAELPLRLPLQPIAARTMVHAELAASLKRRCSQNDDELRSELRAEEGEEVVVAAQQDKASTLASPPSSAEAAPPTQLSQLAKLAERERRLRRLEARLEQEAAAAKQREEEAATPRLVALRQYLELLRKLAASRAKLGPTWNLKLPSESIVPAVLTYFSQLSTGANGAGGPVQLWRSTNVTFIDDSGAEAGIDQGGLTAEMHGTFWTSVFHAEHGLFERSDEAGGSADGQRATGYLPRPGAPAAMLEAAGRVLLKSVIDDHPTGRFLGRFVFEFLCGVHEQRVFVSDRPLEALRALEDFDEQLAEQWRSCVQEEGNEEELGMLTLDMFDPALGEGEVTSANVAGAVVAGCRRVLLGKRQHELEALRRGFTFDDSIDLSLQLAPIPCDQLMLMVRGKDKLSAADLLDCFGFDGAESPTVAAYLRDVITTGLTEEQRWLLLRWCTARSALPANGLAKRVTLLRKVTPSDATPDQWLPEAHTCTGEVELPEYSCREALQRQLLRALEEMVGGARFGML